MTSKQTVGATAPDGSQYGTTTTGAGTLMDVNTVASGSTKQRVGKTAPDGSTYMTMTTGSGTLT